ncbi:MAG: hypothetical protein KBI47_12475 [Armatimonadetes bacterium]|nr:hypothetical protein [Armatimonadota bacterium]MDI9583420.1 hypothetical protein [Acidobacteriota bacterium]
MTDAIVVSLFDWQEFRPTRRGDRHRRFGRRRTSWQNGVSVEAGSALTGRNFSFE